MNTDTPANVQVENRPLSLAQHMRHVATLLKDGLTSYCWMSGERCNCGLLAQSIMGLDSHELCHALSLQQVYGRTWRNQAAGLCPLTGVPEDVIFRQLHAAGMRYSDYSELEFLSNPDVLARLRKSEFGPAKVIFMESESLIAYLETWAGMIEEFHANVARNNAATPPAEADLDAVEVRPLVNA